MRHHAGLSWLLAYLIAVNVVTFGLYAYDKRAAGARGFRIPERTLHLFQLAGGTPCALLGQVVLRHKTSKRRFRAVFWILVVVQLGLIAWAARYWQL